MELPLDFVKEIEGYKSPITNGLIDKLSSSSPVVSVRANVSKGVTRPRSGVEPVEWCEQGWYPCERLPFTFDPAMHQGLYYVQEASSMIISFIVSQLVGKSHRTIKFLDACAAPGGKTTAVIDALPRGSLVVANEYVPSRAATLCENIIKWGYHSSVVTCGDTVRFKQLPAFFDIVLADVPCSGEGMFRKDADAVGQWSSSLVDECVHRQRDIVENLWQTLRPGGYMIYSTCTFNRHENEEMVEHIVNDYGASTINIDIPPQWGIVPGINTECHCYRFMPHLVKGEGLFVSVLRKPEDSMSHTVKCKMPSKKAWKYLDVATLGIVSQWLNPNMDIDFFVEKGRVVAFPSLWMPQLYQLRSTLDIVYCGVTLCAMKGALLVPLHPLAMSTMLNVEPFPMSVLDYATAIAYLRRETVGLSDDVARGYVIVMYKDKPLGFVKNLGKRANNLYPNSWRIRSSHVSSLQPIHVID